MIMKRILLICSVLLCTVTMTSCFKESPEISIAINIKNNSGLDISLPYNYSGLSRNVSIKNGENQCVCSLETFDYYALRKLLGDTVDIAYSDGQHAYHLFTQVEGGGVFAPANNNILDTLSWDEHVLGDNKISRTYTLYSVGSELDN